MINLPPHQRYLTETEVAEMTGRPLSTLRNQRHRRVGFPFVKYGKTVRYKMSDILQEMESNRVSTSSPEAEVAQDAR